VRRVKFIQRSRMCDICGASWNRLRQLHMFSQLWSGTMSPVFIAVSQFQCR